MNRSEHQEKKPAECTLAQLCSMVSAYKSPYEDVAEYIEDRAFTECDSNHYLKAVQQLARLTEFFEQMENKNEENCRDLVDVYILIGEIHQCQENFADSVEWFKKAIIINDLDPTPYHSLAVSYSHLNDMNAAIKCLEQELVLAPGNYYSYFQLADYYAAVSNEEKSEETINRLLRRAPDNIQALHRIITRYQQTQPQVEVELLRRRIVNQHHSLNKVEMVIWTYHMCEEKRFDEALQYLTMREDQSPELTIVNILKAHIYGELRQFTKKRSELARFKAKNNGKQAFMANKLKEFEEIFGASAVSRLTKRLVIAHSSAGTGRSAPSLPA